MEKGAVLEVMPNIDAEYEAAIEHYLIEMERMQTQMVDKQRQIERLQVETQAMLAELKNRPPQCLGPARSIRPGSDVK